MLSSIKATINENRSHACYYAMTHNLRGRLTKTGISLSSYAKTWVRFTPVCRFNVDQVPVPFATDCKTTYEVNVKKEDKPNHPVWVANPGPELEKYLCFLQI